jgi:propanediol dehydratase small subunit
MRHYGKRRKGGIRSMQTIIYDGDEYATLLQRVLVRWQPDDQALYYAAIEYLKHSNQSLEALADKYAEEYHATVWPEQIEELAGEIYASREIETHHNLEGE